MTREDRGPAVHHEFDWSHAEHMTLTDLRGNKRTYGWADGRVVEVGDDIWIPEAPPDWSWSWDGGHLSARWSPLGRSWHFDHDAKGNLTRQRVVMDSDEIAESFAYDTAGYHRVTKYTDPLGHATSMQYDSSGLMTKKTPPTATLPGGGSRTVEYTRWHDR